MATHKVDQARISSIETTVKEQTTTITSLQTTIASLETAIASLGTTIKEKEVIIDNILLQVASLTKMKHSLAIRSLLDETRTKVELFISSNSLDLLNECLH